MRDGLTNRHWNERYRGGLSSKQSTSSGGLQWLVWVSAYAFVVYLAARMTTVPADVTHPLSPTAGPFLILWGVIGLWGIVLVYLTLVHVFSLALRFWWALAIVALLWWAIRFYRTSL